MCLFTLIHLLQDWWLPSYEEAVEAPNLDYHPGPKMKVDECEALGERSVDAVDRSFLRSYYMHVKRKLRVVGVSLR
ncbi:hypothetical protein D918_05472 [Trichuris suis]|nr:hypothetical protein D918_05472 [Trichuris suis]